MSVLEPDILPWLLIAISAAAMLYSSVGHGGASGYLAAMALFGMEPALMKPAALTMNIAVTVLVLARLSHAGHFSWRLFLPFVIGSIPMAFIGGGMQINSAGFRVIVGISLLLATMRMLWKGTDNYDTHNPHLLVALPVGGVLGFVSGLVGVGGGIFLSPLLLLFHWSRMRGSAAIAAAFILVNSVAGLAGFATTGVTWPADISSMVIAALLGALAGSELGVRRVAPLHLRKVLGVVLLIAGVKMIASA